jgi:hypothetical protein
MVWTIWDPILFTKQYRILLIIDKFDPNLILVLINKLKPYRFVEDHTFQLILIKPSDILLEELVETNHSNNIFIEEPIEVTCFDNLFNEKLVETNHSSDLFIEELIQLNIKGLTVNNPIERFFFCNSSNQ